MHRSARAWRPTGRSPAPAAREKALALFEKLRFPDGARIWDSYPFALSGGQCQRAAIAAAMLPSPAVLLCDEPTSALDVLVQKQVVEELLRLRELFGTAMILVTHDIGVARAMADTVLVLKDGRIVEMGPAVQVLNAPRTDYTGGCWTRRRNCGGREPWRTCWKYRI